MAELAMGVPAGVPAANAWNVTRLTTAANNAASKLSVRQTDTKKLTAIKNKIWKPAKSEANSLVQHLANRLRAFQKAKSNLPNVTNRILTKYF